MPNNNSMNMRQLREANPTAAVIMELVKNDLLILLVSKLSGTIDVAVAELDSFPRGKGLALSISEDKKTITFSVVTK